MADQNFQGGSFAPKQNSGRMLDPALTKMAAEDPEAYVAHMKGAGRESELDPSDHIRAATANMARKMKGYFGGEE